MTIQTWDPNRIGGGTIELIQDPTTGIFTTNEVGFVKLPDLTLPAIDQAPYDAPAPDPDPDPDPDPCPDGYKLVDGVCQLINTSDRDGDGDGRYGYGPNIPDTYYDTRTQKMLEKAGGTYPGGYHSAEGGFEYTGTPPYLDIDRDTQPTPPGSGIKVENIGNDPEQNSALASYNQSLKVYNDAIAKANRSSNPNENKNVDEAKALVDQNRKFYEKSIAPGGLFFEGIIPDAPIGDFSRGPRTISTGKVPNYGISDQPTKGTLVGDQFFPDILTTPDLKGVKEVGKNLITTKLKTNVKELFEKGKKSLKIVPVTVRLIGGALDALFGVTDEDRRKQTENKNALTSLGYKTRGELGSNIDPGRVAGDPAEKVFAGMNMVSAKGDIMQGARNRVSTRNSAKTQARVAKRGQEALDKFNAKTKTFQKQINAAQAKKNQQAGNGGGNGGEGQGDRSGGRSSSSGESDYGGFCFDPNTLVQMADGSEKKIKEIQLGDNTKGGEVTGVFQFKAADEIHDYKDVTVAGSHYVKEDDKFIMVQDSPLSVKIDKIPVVYSLDTTGRRIFINDIEFADYNGDGIAKGFLHNAGLNINGFNKEVLRQVEQRLI
jgi:hypothetical protein